MNNFGIYPLGFIAVMILSSCNDAIDSQTATVLNVTEDAQIIMENEGGKQTLKLCGIEVKPGATEYIEQFQGDRVAVVKFGKLADIFVPDGNGGELYLNGILVMKDLAEVNENQAQRCSDPSAFETAEKLRKS